MCGRFTLRASPLELAEVFELLREPVAIPRFNIAPTQSVAVVRAGEAGRELSQVRWGLIPSWAKDEKIGSRLINARGETVAEKPSFRSAFKRRRCLVPADGFYEWKKLDDRSKQPYFIGMAGDEPFAFAGLWEHWTDPGGKEVESCTIITTEANELLAELHDRMPVILHEQDYDQWLDPQEAEKDRLLGLLVPYESSALRAYPVSRLVNSPRNDVAECVKPIDEGRSDGRLFD
ncbi:MAG: SOS response-associated peptidase [Planctomycetota bacterium]|nr:MAG: SOS response-associated peptidase [Planctomycetota bacterium]REJ90748.1 MAG: SOS response-associated peptidase [Planctomycetota bacterium]REK26706.1 MAG: SOS response-associated peptidase [Planctomycetota bacterium]REK35633.1 MAG: SOS response-associated peptidase [Planctomycetota bacterium]